MKDYQAGLIRCRCSNEMRIGKRLQITQYTPIRKRCPNCGRMRKVLVRKAPKMRRKVLIRK